MTTIPPDLACRHLASLWPAPARFAVLDAAGAPAAGDVALAGRAAALLRGAGDDARVVRDGDLLVVREHPDGAALAAHAPRAALPGLLEADLLRLMSADL